MSHEQLLFDLKSQQLPIHLLMEKFYRHYLTNLQYLHLYNVDKMFYKIFNLRQKNIKKGWFKTKITYKYDNHFLKNFDEHYLPQLKESILNNNGTQYQYNELVKSIHNYENVGSMYYQKYYDQLLNDFYNDFKVDKYFKHHIFENKMYLTYHKFFSDENTALLIQQNKNNQFDYLIYDINQQGIKFVSKSKQEVFNELKGFLEKNDLYEKYEDQLTLFFNYESFNKDKDEEEIEKE